MVWLPATLIVAFVLALVLLALVGSGSNLPKKPGSGRCWGCGERLDEPQRLACPQCAADSDEKREPRFQIHCPARCVSCAAPITPTDLNHLHSRLQRWRAGTFCIHCPACQRPVLITIKEMTP